MSQELDDLLSVIRQHPGFKEFQSIVPRPSTKPFRLSNDVYKSTAQWIHESGRIMQHDMWLSMLTGHPPSEQEKS